MLDIHQFIAGNSFTALAEERGLQDLHASVGAVGARGWPEAVCRSLKRFLVYLQVDAIKAKRNLQRSS